MRFASAVFPSPPMSVCVWAKQLVCVWVKQTSLLARMEITYVPNSGSMNVWHSKDSINLMMSSGSRTFCEHQLLQEQGETRWKKCNEQTHCYCGLWMGVKCNLFSSFQTHNNSVHEWTCFSPGVLEVRILVHCISIHKYSTVVLPCTAVYMHSREVW